MLVLFKEFYKNKLYELGDAVEALRRRGSLISREDDVDSSVVNDLTDEVDGQWNDLLEEVIAVLRTGARVHCLEYNRMQINLVSW